MSHYYNLGIIVPRAYILGADEYAAIHLSIYVAIHLCIMYDEYVAIHLFIYDEVALHVNINAI